MRNKFLPLFGAVVLAVLGGCTDSMDSMFDEYNGNFTYRGEVNEILPGDENFQESSMLQEKYPVANDASLTIVAPKAESYKWELYRIEKTYQYHMGFVAEHVEKVEVDFYNRAAIDYQAFSFYLPDIDDVYEGTYELRLEVFANGKTYKDAAMLVVYDPFYDFY